MCVASVRLLVPIAPSGSKPLAGRVSGSPVLRAFHGGPEGGYERRTADPWAFTLHPVGWPYKASHDDDASL